MGKIGGIFEGGGGWFNDWENEKEKRQEEQSSAPEPEKTPEQKGAELAANAIKQSNERHEPAPEEQIDLFDHKAHDEYPD